MISILPSIVLSLSLSGLPSNINYWQAEDHSSFISSSATNSTIGGINAIKLSYTYQFLTNEIFQEQLDTLTAVYLDLSKDNISTIPSSNQPSNMFMLKTFNSSGSLLNSYTQQYSPFDMKSDFAVNFNRFNPSTSSLYRFTLEYYFPVIDPSLYAPIMSTLPDELYFGDSTLYAYTVLQQTMDDIYNEGFNDGHTVGYNEGILVNDGDHLFGTAIYTVMGSYIQFFGMLFDIEFLGISIGYIFTIVIAIAIGLLVLKVIK